MELNSDRPVFEKDACWIVRWKDFAIAHGMKDENGKQDEWHFTMHRLLAYLANPTPQAWIEYMSSVVEDYTSIIPGCCFCLNGFPGNVHNPGCANGLQHVYFGTTRMNKEQEKCKSRDRSQCPGHSSPVEYCLYVHIGSDEVKPCLNRPRGPPTRCECLRRCYNEIVQSHLDTLYI
jgi:hypothetical protein